MDSISTSRVHGGDGLAGVREGMDVHDRDGDRIGSVRSVFLGEAPAGKPPPATTGRTPARPGSIIEQFAEVFANDMPEEIRERLRYHGFVRIDTSGPFAADRYALPDQIAGVSGNAVMLSVGRDELITR